MDLTQSVPHGLRPLIQNEPNDPSRVTVTTETATDSPDLDPLLKEQADRAESSADGRFSTAVRQVDPASVPEWEHLAVPQEDPLRGVRCTPRAARLPARLRERVPASDSVRAWVRDPASGSAPVQAELRASCRLPAKRRVRSGRPEDTRAVAASSIRSPKKAQ